jgi:ribonuclease HI
MEYRCVRTEDGEQLFRAGPFAGGTNNVAEFLAIVHALEWIEKRSLRLPVYSDSENAISWVIAGACKTHLKRTARNASIFALIHSAEGWLEENRLRDGAVRKWETELWGENPADFGRK